AARRATASPGWRCGRRGGIRRWSGRSWVWDSLGALWDLPGKLQATTGVAADRVSGRRVPRIYGPTTRRPPPARYHFVVRQRFFTCVAAVSAALWGLILIVRLLSVGPGVRLSGYGPGEWPPATFMGEQAPGWID